MLRRCAVACAGAIAAMSIAAAAADANPGLRAAPQRVTPSGHVAGSQAKSTPTFDVYRNGYTRKTTCGGFDNNRTTQDWAAYRETYSADSGTLNNWVIGCVFQGNSSTDTTATASGCGDGSAPLAAQGIQASFADGEQVLVCGDPDVNKAKQSNADATPDTVLSQGTSCSATALTQSGGKTTVKTPDSVQFDQDYTDYAGNPVSAVTTVCIGSLPAKSAAASKAIEDKSVKCSQANPFGSGNLAGYAETITYPDGQFEEICEVPNAPARSDS